MYYMLYYYYFYHNLSMTLLISVRNNLRVKIVGKESNVIRQHNV